MPEFGLSSVFVTQPPMNKINTQDKLIMNLN